MRKQNDGHCLALRDKERKNIEDKVKEFLSSGGKIEVLGSAFDKPADPKCKLGEDYSVLI